MPLCTSVLLSLGVTALTVPLCTSVFVCASVRSADGAPLCARAFGCIVPLHPCLCAHIGSARHGMSGSTLGCPFTKGSLAPPIATCTSVCTRLWVHAPLCARAIGCISHVLVPPSAVHLVPVRHSFVRDNACAQVARSGKRLATFRGRRAVAYGGG